MSKTIDLNKYSEQFKAIAYSPVPPCQCGWCGKSEWGWLPTDGEEEATFDCEGCKRSMPWCYGADDHNGFSLLSYCDDCAGAICEGEYDDNDTPRKLG